MSFSKKFALLIPGFALLVGGGVLLAKESHKEFVKADAAHYTSEDRAFKVAEDGSITTTFTVTDSDLNMEGWLLCLYDPTTAPEVDETRKLVGSENIHPYSTEACPHYFFVAEELDSGSITVTWSGSAKDQKEGWSRQEATGEEGHTLKDYFAAGQDWYVVIGPRHINSDWGDHPGDYGAGHDYVWENCDYLLGQKSLLTKINSYDDEIFGIDADFEINPDDYYLFENSPVLGSDFKFTYSITDNSGNVSKIGVNQNNKQYLALEFPSSEGTVEVPVIFQYQYGTAVPTGFYVSGNGTSDLPYTFVPLFTAEHYSSYFLSQTSFCDDYDGVTDNEDNCLAVWTELSRYYNLSLVQSEKQALVTSNNATINEAMSRYEYLVGKYGLTHFIAGRTPKVVGSNVATSLFVSTNAPLMMIVIFASISVSISMVLIFVKKKKHN